MKKLSRKNLWLVIFIGISILFQTAATSTDKVLYPILENGEWGYCSLRGKVVVESQFDYAYSFANGMGRVMNGTGAEGKYGYVNSDGDIIVTPKFSYGYDYSDEYAKVKFSDTIGFINKSGTFIKKPTFKKTGEFHESRALVISNEMSGFINESGKLVIETIYLYASDFSDGKALVRYGVPEIGPSNVSLTNIWYETNTNQTTDLEIYQIETNRIATNLLITATTNTKTVKSMINVITNKKITNYQITVQTNFELKKELTTFFKEIPVTNIKVKSQTNDEIVTYTTNTNFSYQLESYLSNVMVTNEILSYTTNGFELKTKLETYLTNMAQTITKIIPTTNIELTNKRFIRTTNRWITNVEVVIEKFMETTNEYRGMHTNLNVSNAMYGFINKLGTYWLEPQFRDAHEFSEGYAAVKFREGEYDSDDWGFIDEDGNVIAEPQFDEVKDFNNDYAAVKIKNKWTYINTDGEIITEKRFTQAEDFYQDRAIVKLGSKWGVIDSSGEYIAEPEFDWIDNYQNGLTRVVEDGKWGYMNLKGTYAVNENIEEAYPLTNDLARFKAFGLYGFLNKKGETAITPKYIAASDFCNDLAWVVLETNDSYKMGYINSSGDFVWSNTIDPDGDFKIEDMVNVIGPNLTLYKTYSTGYEEPVKITTIPIGVELEVLSPLDTSTLLLAHGLVGFWIKVAYRRNEGSTFSGYLSRYPFPITNSGIQDYFEHKIGVVCESEYIPDYHSSYTNWKLLNMGISLSTVSNTDKSITTTFFIPEMSVQEAYSLTKICLGHPEIPLPDSSEEHSFETDDDTVYFDVEANRNTYGMATEVDINKYLDSKNYIKISIYEEDNMLIIQEKRKGEVPEDL